jgi:hypothetical protein
VLHILFMLALSLSPSRAGRLACHRRRARRRQPSNSYRCPTEFMYCHLLLRPCVGATGAEFLAKHFVGTNIHTFHRPLWTKHSSGWRLSGLYPPRTVRFRESQQVKLEGSNWPETSQ